MFLYAIHKLPQELLCLEKLMGKKRHLLLQESSKHADFFCVCFSTFTSLIFVVKSMVLLHFMWAEWKIKRKKVKQGVLPQASLLVQYIILLELVVLSFLYQKALVLMVRDKLCYSLVICVCVISCSVWLVLHFRGRYYCRFQRC